MDLRQHSVAADDGLALNVWQRAPDDADEAVLFVHGVITNARGLFDTPVEGDDSYSWLRAAAARGRAAYAMDQRGYGDSEVPPEMDDDTGDPPTRAPQAAADIGAVVEWLRDRHDVVHLVGVSWGCHTTGYYCETRDAPVASLVHCAPVYEPAYDYETAVAAIGDVDLDAPTFVQDRETVRARSDHDPAVFEAIWRAQVESNQGIDDERFRVQTGGILDWKASVEGDPAWDPAGIDVPTTVFYGTEDELADRQGSLACFDRLTVPGEYVELSGVDHYMMHGERRAEVFDLVDDIQDRVVAART
jgi:pimeloyl-ACP methyl ester carboxylesterase